jgi:ABC-2 type transport system permease protein
MNGAIFIETLKRSWRQMIYWALGLAVLGFYIVSVIPNVDVLNQYQDLIGTKMPKALMQAFGVSDMAVLATPEGFIAFGFLTYSMILLVVYGVLAGMNITANEEDEGIMEMILAQPVPRWRVVVEKYAAYLLMSAAIVFIAYIGLVLGRMMGTLPFAMDRMLMAGIPMTFGIWLVIAVTAAAGAFFRRKSTALMVVVSFVVLSYFLNFVGNAASDTAAASVKALSFFQYADAQGVVQHGLTVTRDVGL